MQRLKGLISALLSQSWGEIWELAVSTIHLRSSQIVEIWTGWAPYIVQTSGFQLLACLIIAHGLYKIPVPGSHLWKGQPCSEF